MLRKIILFIYIIVVTGLSLLPAGAFPISGRDLFPHADKVVHFGMYALFTFLLFFAWPERFSGKRTQFLPLLCVIAWGTLMEIFQGLGGYGRNFSHLDIMANILGFIPGWLAWMWTYKNKIPHPNR